jgi:hypothetical protein
MGTSMVYSRNRAEFMNKQTLLEMNEYILGKIVAFGEFYKTEDIHESSFSNWNARDVIGHINTWVDFMNKKIESFKKDNLFKDKEKFEVAEYNKESFIKNKNKDIKNIIQESREIYGNFGYCLELFTEDELFSTKFETGFDVVLWRYISMDLITHPINHMLYQYLKRKNYKEFIFEAEEVYKYRAEYSDDNDTIYYFRDLFENEEEKGKFFMEISEKFNENKIVEEIIKINMK